jgi:hypothetical protein
MFLFASFNWWGFPYGIPFLIQLPLLVYVKSITAGTHSSSSKSPSSYISLNVYTGSGIIREILARNGIKIDERKVKIVLHKIKDIAVKEGRTIEPFEVIKFYGEVQ